MSNALLNTTQAAQALGVTSRRVLALIQSGRLPARKLGRDWIISSRDLARVAHRNPGRPSKSKRGRHT